MNMMKFTQFHNIITRPKKNKNITCQNNENHEIRKIQCQNNTKQSDLHDFGYSGMEM